MKNLQRAVEWIDKQVKAGKPFFCYYNSTRMHIFKHLSSKYDGKTCLGIEADGITELDDNVGTLLK